MADTNIEVLTNLGNYFKLVFEFTETVGVFQTV